MRPITAIIILLSIFMLHVIALAQQPVWSLPEVIDPSTTVGMYASIAVDSQNRPHTVYYDSANADLKYAYKDISGWHASVIDNTGDVGKHTSIAIASDDTVCVAYYDVTNGDLKCAMSKASSWSIETVDSSGDVGTYPSLTFDAQSAPHIAYYKTDTADLIYIVKSSGQWRREVVDSSGDVGRFASLCLDASGNPHIAYMDYTNSDLKYAVRSSTGWKITTLVSIGNVGWYSSLAIDSNDNEGIAHYDSVNQRLLYIHRTSTGWISDVVDTSNGPGRYCKIAFDIGCRPHIAYQVVATSDLRYAFKNQNGWQIQNVDSVDAVGKYSGIALEPLGNAQVVYYDETYGRLKYARSTAPPDTSPPTQPLVMDKGHYTTNTSQFSGSWSSSDPDSGIAEYAYGLGTSPGTVDILDWRSSGISTSTTISGFSLAYNTLVFLNVKARNNAGMWSSIGFSDGIRITIPLGNTVEAKFVEDGNWCVLLNQIVTADNKDFESAIYVIDPTRTSGIRAEWDPWASLNIDRGNNVDLFGQLALVSGERTLIHARVDIR